MTTIIHKAEVIRLAGLDSKFPISDIAEIGMIERSFFRENYGEVIYDKFLDDKNSYPDTAWNGASTVGQIYVYNGVYWECTSTGNTVPGGSGWKLADKFDNTDYQNIWVSSLGSFLANLVTRESIIPASLNLTGSGVVKRFGDNFEQVGHSDRKDLLSYYDRKIGRILKVLDADLRSVFELKKDRPYGRKSGGWEVA